MTRKKSKSEEFPTLKRMGRPPKPFDHNIFEGLCAILCTEEEIASAFDFDVTTLYRKVKKEYGDTFAKIYKRFSKDGIRSIRRKQFEKAMEGNTDMLKWLGKNMVGQKDKIDHEVKGKMFEKVTVTYVDKTEDTQDPEEDES